MKTVALAMTIGLVAALGGAARAGVTVDQSYLADPTVAVSIDGHGPLGQSFVTFKTSLDVFEYAIVNAGSTPGVFTVQILEGEGLNGTVLGTSGPVSVLPNLASGVGSQGLNAVFDFATPVSLSDPFDSYTAVLTQTSGSMCYVQGTFAQGYSPGNVYFTSPPSASVGSLDFIEGVRTPGVAVPEPSSLVLTGAGLALGMLTAGRVRRGRKANGSAPSD
jgi:hypothetical protein